MADFNIAILTTLAREGGAKFTDDPVDKGGATKYGISQRAYPRVDIKNLTEQQARDIYKSDYWDRLRCDEINSQSIAEQLFDTGVNMGVRTTARLAQVALHIDPADGVIGGQSLSIINALNKEEESLFMANFTLAKIARYAYLCNKDRSQSKFLLGWLNRALGVTV